jgi:hypothetical protein
MIEVHPLLHVGSERDYEAVVRHRTDWRVVHACKEPYHRQTLGYSGRAAPKGHPEYLIARRGHRLILNLVDAPDPAYIPKEIIDAALAFIHESLGDNANVLVHCNEGCSRAPSIALLYLLSRTNRLPHDDINAAVQAFQTIYPAYLPAGGVAGFVRINFPAYCQAGNGAGEAS